MGHLLRRTGGAALLIAATACGSSGSSADAGATGADATATHDGAKVDGATHDGMTDVGVLRGSDASTEGGNGCQPPDVLIVLDRSLSMSQLPSGSTPSPDNKANQEKSKFYLATEAIDAVTGGDGGTSDETIRFGLEVLPGYTADAGRCTTLAKEIGGSSGKGDTDYCTLGGLVLFPPALGNATAIQKTLDPETFPLCGGTPIAGALETAATLLAKDEASGRAQYIVLITDGAETCGAAAVASGVATVQALSHIGVHTFVIGFGSSGVNVSQLNNLACGGSTAISDAGAFPAPCVKEDGGYVEATSKEHPVFFSAQDGADIAAALHKITGSVCCGCGPK